MMKQLRTIAFLALCAASAGAADVALGPAASLRWVGSGTVYAATWTPAGPTLTNGTITALNMTNTNAPAPYVAAASYVASGTYAAWKMFDGVADSRWYITPTTSNSWVSFDRGADCKLTSYSIKLPSAYTVYYPKGWSVQGSPDNSTWTTVDTRSNETTWDANARTYTLGATSASFRYWRILWQTFARTDFIFIDEIELYGLVP